MPINPPDSNPKRELARKLAEATVAGVLPVIGGPLMAIFSVTHPAKGEQDVKAWQEDISALVSIPHDLAGHSTNTWPPVPRHLATPV